MSSEQKAAFYNILKDQIGVLHHGMCIGGDADGHVIAKSLNYWVIGHPPQNPYLVAQLECDELRLEMPYLIRNKNIVDETEMLIAVPAEPEEQQRGGTWSTYRYAKKIGKSTVLILPNGNVVS